MEALRGTAPTARHRVSLASERDLVLAAKEGDDQARDRLVGGFMPLVAGVARVRGDEGLICTFGDMLADPQAEAAFEGVPHHLEVERMRRLRQIEERALSRLRDAVDAEGWRPT